jgi:hypothetical protein
VPLLRKMRRSPEPLVALERTTHRGEFTSLAVRRMRAELQSTQSLNLSLGETVRCRFRTHDWLLQPDGHLRPSEAPSVGGSRAVSPQWMMDDKELARDARPWPKIAVDAERLELVCTVASPLAALPVGGRRQQQQQQQQAARQPSRHEGFMQAARLGHAQRVLQMVRRGEASANATDRSAATATIHACRAGKSPTRPATCPVIASRRRALRSVAAHRT